MILVAATDGEHPSCLPLLLSMAPTPRSMARSILLVARIKTVGHLHPGPARVAVAGMEMCGGGVVPRSQARRIRTAVVVAVRLAAVVVVLAVVRGVCSC